MNHHQHTRRSACPRQAVRETVGSATRTMSHGPPPQAGAALRGDGRGHARQPCDRTGSGPGQHRPGSARPSGSIPAHAGKPPRACPSARGPTVYPRPRGEAARVDPSQRSKGGLSPPTRGSQPLESPLLGTRRSIPAHAGKPGGAARRQVTAGVYPRPRGEARRRRGDRHYAGGLSPPTRGSHGDRGPHGSPRGSIPAHAGKPASGRAPAHASGVYPRPRGEACSIARSSGSADGLSPPTRGSPVSDLGRLGTGESIPAHAGKPCGRPRTRHCTKVYPRPRGEAADTSGPRLSPTGLSPPTRGSRSSGPSVLLQRGSIPAHAGKPDSVALSSRYPPVYPRPRGEAPYRVLSCECGDGLSPPTRGSLFRPRASDLRLGSIPAHAGKPAWACPHRAPSAVYPRPRGEAAFDTSRPGPSHGLSPPTRGGHLAVPPVTRSVGSIPAHAGKPYALRLTVRMIEVYPRPRGEALRLTWFRLVRMGLSPPTRGSHERVLPARHGGRSIPAHAGKPSSWRPVGNVAAVYPRPRGEALHCGWT